MTSPRPRLLEDILAQPDSLARVLHHQSGAGREALTRAAALLHSAKSVLLASIGASMFSSTPFEYFLASQGKPAFLVEAAELLHYRHQVGKDSVVVLVSRSGESVEIVKLVAVLKGRVPIVGISNEPASTLAKESDVSIHIGSLPDEMVAIQSYTGTLLTLHLLGNAFLKREVSEDRDLLEALEKLPSLISREVASLTQWDPLLNLHSPFYLLGRGYSYASVLEGALLFHETAKSPAVGMLAGSFRHGPVEAVDAQFAGVVFAPNGPTRHLNLSLAKDITRFGGHVRVIGPESRDTEGLEVCATPDVSERLAPLLEVVPLQCASLRLAQLRGWKIGSFRYTPQVTRDEARFGS